jgi:hypothetical protein
VGRKLIDGKGKAHECRRADDLFKAAIGGIGAVGVISEVVVQGVERCDVEQEGQTKILCRERTRPAAAGERPLEPVSVPLRRQVQGQHLEPHGQKPISSRRCSGVREDFHRRPGSRVDRKLYRLHGVVAPGVFPGLRCRTQLEPDLESNKAFSRTIYHLHQELEFTIPFEDTFEVSRRFIRLYEEMYHQGLPYTLFEVRFMPKRERILIGAQSSLHVISGRRRSLRVLRQVRRRISSAP